MACSASAAPACGQLCLQCFEETTRIGRLDQKGIETGSSRRRPIFLATETAQGYPDRNFPAFRGELQGIADQIVDHLLDSH